MDPRAKADTLLHPVRLRIVQAFMLDESMTVAELGRILGDVPQASLYRHLNRLVDAGFVDVVAERPAGGATERVYAVVPEAVSLTAEDVASLEPADHMRYFTAFCAALMGSFDRYLQRDRIDFAADGVGYRSVSLWLNDEEFQQLLLEMNRPFREAVHNKPKPGRHRRLFATVVMPDGSDDEDFTAPDAPLKKSSVAEGEAGLSPEGDGPIEREQETE